MDSILDLIGVLFPLGFLFFFFWIFRRIVVASRKAGGMQQLQEQVKKRAAEAQALQQQGRPVPPITTLQDLLAALEEKPRVSAAQAVYQRSQVESTKSEAELDHSIEDDLPSYESLVPLGQQVEQTTSIEDLLPHYERIEGVKSIDNHPIYGKQADMSRVQTVEQQDSIMLAGLQHGLTRHRQKAHPLRKHLRNPTNFRMALLTSFLLERKS